MLSRCNRIVLAAETQTRAYHTSPMCEPQLPLASGKVGTDRGGLSQSESSGLNMSPRVKKKKKDIKKPLGEWIQQVTVWSFYLFKSIFNRGWLH